ncbi:MAG: hypothetical protein IKM02_03630 [Clostridia bacterium]|nr:hypothetical protein [Clostridia bacterium]
MQCLERSMLERYDITPHAPHQVKAVFFGTSAVMLGMAARLLDDAAPDVGAVCVQTDNSGFAEKLNSQDGLYTVIVRGYLNDRDVHREHVVQNILRAVNPETDFEAVTALAKEETLSAAFLDTESDDASAAIGLASKLLYERMREGLPGLHMICLGETAECAEAVRQAVLKIAASWNVGEGFADWLEAACAFYPALADCLVSRSTPEEAARLCAEMNYADAMIHIAEPYASLVIQAPESFRQAYPWEKTYGIRFTDDIRPEFIKKHRIFDAGLFLMAGPGYLAGCNTLRDCMQKENLREYIGRAFFDEIIPNMPFAREEIAPYVISAFERFENPLNDNRLLDCAHHLMKLFMRGVLPVIRTWSEENFEVPPLLGHAFAAAIMLYAGVRPNARGVYEVARGEETHELNDRPEILEAFACLAHDMPCESLAYAVLADRNIWNGEDLRDIDGLESRVVFSISAIQQGYNYK